MILKTYHGTNLSSAFDIWLHGINLNKSLPNLDFGKGFYVTDSKEKAIDRALKKKQMIIISDIIVMKIRILLKYPLMMICGLK